MDESVSRRRGKKRKITSHAKEDRFSQLPDEIIHSIFYLAYSPTTVARTSVLSRRWLHLWRSYPVIEFKRWDKTDLSYHHSEVESRSALAAVTSRRGFGALDAVRISLQMYEPSFKPAVDELSSNLTANGLSPVEFVLDAGRFYANAYVLPEGMFSNWSRTKVGKLHGCDFSPNVNQVLNLGMLQDLTLEDVTITEEVFRNFLANAPQLHSLKLERIGGVEKLEVCARSLKTLRIWGHNSRLDVLLASAPLLENLQFWYVHEIKLKVGTTSPSSAAPNLKLLDIGNSFPEFTLLDAGDWIPDSISPETLCISSGESSKTRRLRISSSKLRNLNMEHWYEPELEEVEIDAPDLVSINCSYHVSPIFPASNFRVVNTASNCQYVTDLHMHRLPLLSGWFVGMRRFFSTLCSQFPHLVLKFHLLNLQTMSEVHLSPLPSPTVPESPSGSPSPTVREVQFADELFYFCDSERVAAFVHEFLWMCRPEYMLIKIPRNKTEYGLQFSENMCKQFMNRDLPNCCGNTTCWRHDLKDAKVMVDSTVTTAISEDVITSLRDREEIRLKLTWC